MFGNTQFTKARFSKAVAAAAIGAGACLALAAPASADDVDPAKFGDYTHTFVNGTNPAAAARAAQDGKNIVVSPYGTSHTIACKGNGTTVPLYECLQEDDLGWITLQKLDLPGLGPAWVYIP
ncbi:hypothetical protein AB0H71_11435 [Nocardia sp. NPDC050697]|uniref:hypothetical protein n=1 Tax=Nocardia sp. NPDC050697 TaxID=3155158 RepID=UPI0033C30D53